MALRQVSHPGLLPPHGRHDLDRGNPARDRAGDDGIAHLRTTGTHDRPGQPRIDGAQEGGRLLLMSYHEAPTIAATDAPRLGRDDRPTLRFVTCGSVDDGKSTLVGRLLYDSKMLLDDQLDTLTSDSRVSGTAGAQ